MHVEVDEGRQKRILCDGKHLNSSTMGGLTRLHLSVLLLLPVALISFSLSPSRALGVSTQVVKYPDAFRSPTNTWAVDSGNFIDEAEDTLRDKVRDAINRIDKHVMKRAIRIGNHLPALLSLSYFGLISMNMGGMSDMTLKSPLAAALVRPLGSTTSAQFSAFFPTPVTPASFVFFVWPIISVLQLFTVSASALRSGKPLLSQADLTSLSLANLAATAWLVVSSQTVEGDLRLASFIILPLVPLLSGFPLRTMRKNPKTIQWKNTVFQLYSSFTTIASLLALAVELQHGGRVPFLKGRGEVVAALFLAMYGFLLRLPGQGDVKRVVNAGAIAGIVFKRLADGLTWRKSLSVSLLGSCAVAIAALKNLVTESDENDTWASDTTLEDVKAYFDPED
jgi:hypothetical protein